MYLERDIKEGPVNPKKKVFVGVILTYLVFDEFAFEWWSFVVGAVEILIPELPEIKHMLK